MATYYVDINAADDLGNGAIGTPFKTIAHAVSHMASGDTLYFRSGTWNEALDLGGKAYASLTTFARYTGDAAGSAILDGNGLNLDPYEEGVVWIHATSANIRVDGLKVINASHTGIAVLSSANIDIRNCISDYSLHSGIATWNVSDSTIYNNTIYDANMPAGSEEVLSICASSTNIEVSYNTLYAGDRTLGQIGGEGLNIKDGCSYIYVHHNTVDQTRPDAQESDRYCMGVDGWSHETHHIYFWNNTLKGGSWGLQYNSEDGGATHHIYGWNNIISHIGHGSMHGGGIGMPSYGTQLGLCDYLYWWNNTVFDCYYGARFNQPNIGAPIQVTNNIFDNCESTVISYGSGVNSELITLATNLTDGTDPKFLNEGTLDFHLTAESTNCIDQGTTLTGPSGPDTDVSVDYDLVARPQGTAFDIGAYEYESGVISTVSIYVGEE